MVVNEWWNERNEIDLRGGAGIVFGCGEIAGLFLRLELLLRPRFALGVWYGHGHINLRSYRLEQPAGQAIDVGC